MNGISLSAKRSYLHPVEHRGLSRTIKTVVLGRGVSRMHGSLVKDTAPNSPQNENPQLFLAPEPRKKRRKEVACGIQVEPWLAKSDMSKWKVVNGRVVSQLWHGRTPLDQSRKSDDHARPQ